jgi:hypothetical protein
MVDRSNILKYIRSLFTSINVLLVDEYTSMNEYVSAPLKNYPSPDDDKNTYVMRWVTPLNRFIVPRPKQKTMISVPILNGFLQQTQNI